MPGFCRFLSFSPFIAECLDAGQPEAHPFARDRTCRVSQACCRGSRLVYSPDHLHDSLAFMHDFLVALLVDDGQLALHEYAEIHRRVVVPA